jgi:hypothetical protein
MPIRIILVTGALICAVPALAKDCRRPAAHLDLPKGCEFARNRTEAYEIDRRLRSDGQGFVDLGNGTKVRITGRVRGEARYRR